MGWLQSVRPKLLHPWTLKAFKVYLCQLKAQFAQIEVHDEKPDYTMGQMLRNGLMTESIDFLSHRTQKSDMGGIFGFFLGTSMVSVVYSFRAASRKLGFCISKIKNLLEYLQMGNSEPQTVHSSTSMSWNERFEAEFGQQLPFKGKVLHFMGTLFSYVTHK